MVSDTSKALQEKFQEPFHPNDLEWRLAHNRRSQGNLEVYAFAYVTNRAIMNRLDDTVGVLGWQSDVRQLHTVRTVNSYDGSEQIYDGFLMSISVRDPETGEWVEKMDGADNSNMEPIKGGISGASKRAGVSLGIGRYLYNLPNLAVVMHDDAIKNEKIRVRGEGEVWITWSPPPLPSWALPEPRFNFSNMQKYLIENYKAEEHSSLVAKVGYGYRNLGHLMGVLKNVWGQDYYLTLAAYEAVYDALNP